MEQEILQEYDNCQLTVTHPHHVPVGRDHNLSVKDIQVSKQCFPKVKN
jgi:hypothetical protein